MPTSASLAALGATALAGGVLAHSILRNHEVGGSLPPSPRSYPLIGHLLSIPQENEHVAYSRMSKELGSDIISVSALGTTIVVLNSREDAENLFDKRGAIYSDRGLPIVMSDPRLLDWGGFAGIIRYGERWKTYRRLMSPWTTRAGTVMFHDSQQNEARLLLRRLLNLCGDVVSSKDLESELLLGFGSVLFRAIYGYKVQTLKDPILARAQSLFTYAVEACLPSTYWVSTIPVLKYIPSWLPGAGWKRTIEQWREKKNSIIRDTYQFAVDQINEGGGRDTIVATLREEALRLGLSQEETDDYVKQIAIALHAGGTETNINTILIFFMAMVHYPEVQHKAQQELDTVVGDVRLPNFEDQSQLGYVMRVVQETLRWKPTTPFALPHACLENDTYRGYRIPRGSIVMANVWAMTRDPKVYPNPETFEPDRFLDPSVPTAPAFGWGRRVCPGEHFAEAAIFIFIASVFSVFNISAAKDKNGDDIMPTPKMSHGVVVRPEAFVFKLTPRSEKHRALAVDSALEVQNEVDY